MLGSAIIVDVKTVRMIMDDLNIGAQFCKRGWSYLVGGAISRIKDDLHAFH